MDIALLTIVAVSLGISLLFFVIGLRYLQNQLNSKFKFVNKRFSDDSERIAELVQFTSRVDDEFSELFKDIHNLEDACTDLKKEMDRLNKKKQPTEEKPKNSRGRPKKKPSVVVEPDDEWIDEEEVPIENSSKPLPVESSAKPRGYELPQTSQPPHSTRRGNPTGRVNL